MSMLSSSMGLVNYLKMKTPYTASEMKLWKMTYWLDKATAIFGPLYSIKDIQQSKNTDA